MKEIIQIPGISVQNNAGFSNKRITFREKWIPLTSGHLQRCSDLVIPEKKVGGDPAFRPTPTDLSGKPAPAFFKPAEVSGKTAGRLMQNRRYSSPEPTPVLAGRSSEQAGFPSIFTFEGRICGYI